jgi:hypothetical protein
VARPPDPTTGSSIFGLDSFYATGSNAYTPLRSKTTVFDGLARLTQQFQNKPILTAELGSWLRRAQEAENAVWQILTLCTLAFDFPAGVQLQTLCKIVGAPVLDPGNGGVSSGTLEMEALLFVQIAINRSSGRITDFYKTLGVAFSGVVVSEAFPATVMISIHVISLNTSLAVFGVAQAIAMAQSVKAAGVRVLLFYSAFAASQIFTFSSSNAELSDTGRGWGDTTSSVGGHLTGVAAI